jgi:hypothetical protein
MEDIIWTHKTEFLGNVLEQNVNISILILKITKTPDNLNSTHAN